MALGLILGIGRAYRRKRTSSLDILSSKRQLVIIIRERIASPLASILVKFKETSYCFFCPHKVVDMNAMLKLRLERKHSSIVIANSERWLPNYVAPDLTDFKLKPYVSQCPR